MAKKSKPKSKKEPFKKFNKAVDRAVKTGSAKKPKRATTAQQKAVAKVSPRAAKAIVSRTTPKKRYTKTITKKKK